MNLMGCGLAVIILLAAVEPLPRTNLKLNSCRAELVQRSHTTLLELNKQGRVTVIPLTHPSQYPQVQDSPYQAQLIAEIPSQLLIFTDTFISK
jgi:hypothetical protein